MFVCFTFASSVLNLIYLSQLVLLYNDPGACDVKHFVAVILILEFRNIIETLYR